jgi:hypothetical protein
LLIIASNPIVQGSFEATHSLIQPVEFTLPSGPVVATRLNYQLAISGNWYVQQVTLNATGTIYNWLSHRMGRSPGRSEYSVNEFEPMGGTIISEPPNWVIEQFNHVNEVEIDLRFLVIEGLEETSGGVPNLDHLIEPADLDIFFKEMGPGTSRSVNA